MFSLLFTLDCYGKLKGFSKHTYALTEQIHIYNRQHRKSIILMSEYIKMTGRMMHFYWMRIIALKNNSKYYHTAK